MLSHADKYRDFRKSFRKYPVDQLLTACISYLYIPEKNKIDKLGKRPWLIFLFIKWVMLDGCPNGKKDQQLTNDEFNRLLKKLNQYFFLDASTKFDHPYLLIRNIAFQQFPFQGEFNTLPLARQWLFFAKHEDDHFFRQAFRDHIGLEISKFLQFLLVLLSRFISLENSGELSPLILAKHFKPEIGDQNFSDEEVTLFLDSLSITTDNHEKHLKRNNNPSEIYETSAFFKRPLIKTRRNEYLCVHPNVLYRAAESAIYDRLKEIDVSKFNTKFGISVFETYITKGLEYAQLEFWSEADLKKKLGATGKVVDFAIFDEESIILADAKAVEMREHGKVTAIAKHIEDCIQTSAIKAISQALETLNRGKKTFGDKTPFLLVVTYKDLHLRSGSFLYEVIAKEKLDALTARFPETNLPPENIFFISIEDFDLLMEALSSRSISLSSFLFKAREENEDPSSEKFALRMFLEKPKRPQYLSDAADEWLTSMEGLYPDLKGRI